MAEDAGVVSVLQISCGSSHSCALLGRLSLQVAVPLSSRSASKFGHCRAQITQSLLRGLCLGVIVHQGRCSGVSTAAAASSAHLHACCCCTCSALQQWPNLLMLVCVASTLFSLATQQFHICTVTTGVASCLLLPLLPTNPTALNTPPPRLLRSLSLLLFDCRRLQCSGLVGARGGWAARPRRCRAVCAAQGHSSACGCRC